MTTLPQSTPLRLPRPTGGAGQIAIPSAGHIGAVAGGGGGGNAGMIQMTAGDVWRVFRSNAWLIIVMVVVAGVSGIFVNRYLAAHYPKYTASALVKVQLQEEMFAQNNGEVNAAPQAIEVELKTQVRGLLQPGLMLTTLTKSDKIRQTQWFKDCNSNAEIAKEDLLKNFTATPIQNSRLIQVEMTYRVPKDARTILEEVVNQYIDDQQSRLRTTWELKAQQLETTLANYERDYKKIKDELTGVSTKLNSDNLFQAYSLLETKKYNLSHLTDTLMVAQREYTEVKNQYDSMEAQISSGETPPEIEAKIMENSMIAAYQHDIDEADVRAGVAGGVKTNSLTATTLRKKQELEKKRDDQKEQLRSSYVAAKRIDLQTKLKAADDTKKATEESIKVATGEIRDMQAAAATFKLLDDQEHTLKVKMDDVSDDLDKIQHRKLPSNWASVSMFAPPPTPETPSFPQLKWTLCAALAIGLSLSVGIAFLREITDTTVRSPRDIARVGNLTMLGMIPHEQDDPQAAGARLPLVIFDAPHSVAAEEFRKLRTRLQHAASLDSTRSILVSSANPGDGKTTVAANLAAGLALNGRRILLVDANFRRPDIHNLFEISNEKGFSDALNDMAAFDTVVRDTPVQNLYVMPTGPKPVNGTELLESQLLIDFIERALEDYDHVIFDSGPLLIVSETMALAPRVDGVVTVVRARTNSRGVLTRMRDALRQVKAEHLGVVLNAVRSQGGGYYGRNIKTYYAYQNS